MEENTEKKIDETILTGAMVEFQKQSTGTRLYTQEEFLDTSKPLDEATKDAESEMSVEEQQSILRDIIQGSKQKAAKFYKSPGQMIAKDADKKRKLKIKAAKKARKKNRKNK